MVQQWPPVDPTADDHRRLPTHRMVCFQQGDQDPKHFDGPVASWCALYPLAAGPFAEPEIFVRLDPDRSRLLDLDTGAAVAATRLGDRRWEVRPPAGEGVMVTSARTSDGGPGFAEAKGLPPLIIPRRGRRISPYAVAFAGRTWVSSPSLESVGGWRRRRRRAVLFDVFIATALTGTAVAAAMVGHPAAILFGGAAAYNGVSMIRRRWQDRVVTAEVPSTSGAGGDSADVASPSMRTVVHLDWRPSPDWGALAWVVIADDKDGQLEAPVAGLTEDWIDRFPTMATVDGTFGSGKPVRLTLDDGSVLRTIRPLRRAR